MVAWVGRTLSWPLAWPQPVQLACHLCFVVVVWLWCGPCHPSPLRLGWDGSCLAWGPLARVGERRGWCDADGLTRGTIGFQQPAPGSVP